MGRIYQRTKGGTYYAYWTDTKNRHHRKALGTGDATVARARLRELELAATNPAAYSRTSLTTAIGALLDVVALENAEGTLDSYTSKGGHLRRILGDIELRSLEREHVVSYMKQRAIEGSGSHTVHKELVVLRRTLTEAQNRKWWDGDVRRMVPTIKVDYQPRETWLTDHQAQQLLVHVAPIRRLWVLLGIYGGLCLGEIERLRWENIDFSRGSMRVPGTKRKARWRVIPVFPELLAELRAVKRPTGLVVGKWSNVRRALARAADLAKVPRVTPNDLRRTCASWLKNKGVDSAVVAGILGNSTVMIDRVYGKISFETLQTAVGLLPVPDRCATGEQRPAASSLTNETRETSSKRAVTGQSSSRKVVPRDGVEPPTRGFSGLTDLNDLAVLKIA